MIRIGNTQTRAFIAGIRGVVTGIANAIPVLIDSAGQLGTTSSAQRFKTDITALTGSEVIYQLNPVSFRYIQNAPDSSKSIGLIAEQVEPVYPDMVIYDNDEIFTVDYSRIPILLLAEAQKTKTS